MSLGEIQYTNVIKLFYPLAGSFAIKIAKAKDKGERALCEWPGANPMEIARIRKCGNVQSQNFLRLDSFPNFRSKREGHEGGGLTFAPRTTATC